MFAHIFDSYMLNFEGIFMYASAAVNFVACVLVQALQPFSVWPKQLLGVDARHFEWHGCFGQF
jgi:hypothetical protein